MYTCLCDKIFPKGKTLKLKLRKFLYAFFSKNMFTIWIQYRFLGFWCTQIDLFEEENNLTSQKGKFFIF